MTKTEMKRVIFSEFLRLVEPDNFYDMMPSGLSEPEEERWAEACREVRMEMERRSRRGQNRRPLISFTPKEAQP